MRKILLLALALALLLPTYYLWAGASRPGGAPGGKVVIGEQAPDFTLRDLAGKTVTLSALEGKVVLVNFWATWCPPCRTEMPSMERLYRAFKGQDFEMLAINVEEDGAKVLPNFLSEHPHSFPVLLDEKAEVQSSYGVFRYPETFVVGKNGVVVDKVIGARDWSSPKMIEYIKFLVNG